MTSDQKELPLPSPTYSLGCRCQIDPCQCPLCHLPLIKGRAIFTTTCSHSYHYSCIQPRYLHGLVQCPACEQPMKEPPSLLQDRTTNERWFFGNITRDDAERVLRANGGEGIFLVRESRTQPGQYCLSFLNDKLRHCIIFINDRGQYYLTPSRAFRTLSDLVAFYSSESLNCVGGISGCFKLTGPCKVRLEDL